MWQGRFYSCPLDERHLWEALRYVELNPLRAEMVETAERWRWSSAAAHGGFVSPDPILEMERWSKRWTAGEWRGYLAQAESATELGVLRRFTHTGRPLGSPEFVAELEGFDVASACPDKKRPPEESRRRSRPAQPRFHCLITQKWGTSRLSPICPDRGEK